MYQWQQGRELLVSAAWGGGGGGREVGESAGSWVRRTRFKSRLWLHLSDPSWGGHARFQFLYPFGDNNDFPLGLLQSKGGLESTLLTVQPWANISYDYSIMLLPEKQGVGVSIGSQSGFPCNGDIQIMQGWKVSFLHVCFSRPCGGDSEPPNAGPSRAGCWQSRRPRTVLCRQLVSLGWRPVNLSVLFCLHLETVEHMKQISPCT